MCVCVCVGGISELYVLSAQFFCKSKAVLKNLLIKKRYEKEYGAKVVQC